MIQETSSVARQVDSAFFWIGGICLLLLVCNTVAMIVFAVKYRRSRARTAAQIASNRLLETVWIVVPTMIVLWMFYVGFRNFRAIRTPPSNAMIVEVTGRQWSWSFHYPTENVDAGEMAVPVNVAVKAELTTPIGDVIHGFYIPDFRIKEDALPGKHTYVWFKAERKGTYNIFCSQFCGAGHSQMRTLLRVLSPEDYKRWIEKLAAMKYKPLVFEGIVDPNFKEFGKSGLNIESKPLFGTFCASCHGVKGDGSGLPGVARNFTQLKGWKRSLKVTDIFRTLMLGVDGTQMRPFPNLTPWEKVALAHYVRAFLKEKPPRDTKADYDRLVQEFQLDKIQGPPRSIPVERAMALLVQEASRPATSSAASRP